MRKVFAEAGLRDISEEQVSGEMAHETPEQYWEFVCESPRPWPPGSRERMRPRASRSVPTSSTWRPSSGRDGAIHLRSTATIISGTR